MENRNYSEIVPGLLLAVFGTIVALYSLQNYNIGTAQRMGPGMFPMALGVCIAVLGLALAVAGWFKTNGPRVDFSTIQWRAGILILIAVTVFALLIRTVGLIPAVCGVVGISAFADKGARLSTALTLCVILCVMAWLIFQVGLGMNLRLLDWAF